MVFTQKKTSSGELVYFFYFPTEKVGERQCLAEHDRYQIRDHGQNRRIIKQNNPLIVRRASALQINPLEISFVFLP